MAMIEKIEITLQNGKKAEIKKNTIDGDYILKAGFIVIFHGDSFSGIMEKVLKLYE